MSHCASFLCLNGLFEAPFFRADCTEMFKNAFVVFPAQFLLSKALLHLVLRVFVLQNYFCAFHGAALTFESTFEACLVCFFLIKSTFETSLAYFCTSKVFSRLISTCFPLSKVFLIAARCVFSTQLKQKSLYSKEFLWQK